MFFRGALLSSVLMGISAALSGHAQIESDSMDDLGAWGQRYLSSNETEFPTTLWRNSNDEFLLSLLQSVNTTDLGPAERRLLRRIILSPATPPSGVHAESLLAERARLMLELGEARAAAALVPRLEQAAPGLDAETLAVDLDLASGQEASACGTLNGEYWLKLRAVCAVLRDNYSGAQLAIEVAAAQGVDDPWMVEAIFAASGDTPNPPGAKFDSGLNIALSSKAVLDTNRVTLSGDRPYLAAAAALRPGVPAELRARFAEIASAKDLIHPDDRRTILLDRFADEDYAPTNPLEQAFATLRDPISTDAARAESVASVLSLSTETGLNGLRPIAQLFVPDLKTLPQSLETAPYALDFARAALAAGELELAQSWLSAASLEGVEPADAYDIALTEAVAAIITPDVSTASLRAIEKRLTSSVNSERREQQAGRVFTAWIGLGLPLSPIARDFVASVPDSGERIPQGQLTALKAARLGDAISESALMILVTTRGDVARLSPTDLTEMLEALIALDAEDVARDLALEATVFWEDVN